jgi:hypothetical protein
VVPAENTQKHNAGRIFGTSGNIAAVWQQNESMNFTALAPVVPFFDTSGTKMGCKKHHFWHQSHDLVPVVPHLALMVPQANPGTKRSLYKSSTIFLP